MMMIVGAAISSAANDRSSSTVDEHRRLALRVDHQITIGYVTVDDPNDRRSWSGTDHFLKRAMEEHGCRMVDLGPLRPQPELLLCRIFNAITLRLLGKRFNYRASFIMSRAYRRVLLRRMAGQRLDLLVAPAGLCTTALLDTSVPIIHINDRSIAGALGYHDILKDLFRFSERESLALERRALLNASLTIYSSEWAADAARRAEPAAARTVEVLPFGINFPQAPAPPAPRSFPSGPVKLLFIGVHWENKGGPIAHEALLELERRGIAAQLIVCGCEPPARAHHPNMIREGFLDKNVPAELERLQHHLRTADFLIVPTRFEAYGIVFCEAAAYGVPALGTRTGGVPTIVQDGLTGFLFDLEEGGVAYAERIAQLMNEPAEWQVLRGNARKRYEEVLNWSAFVQGLLAHAVPLVSKDR